jgi:hypothetical protein
MNIGMVPKETLDSIAGFPVASVFKEKLEVSLLGEEFHKVVTLSHKDFWKAYRRITR